MVVARQASCCDGAGGSTDDVPMYLHLVSLSSIFEAEPIRALTAALVVDVGLDRLFPVLAFFSPRLDCS